MEITRQFPQRGQACQSARQATTDRDGALGGSGDKSEEDPAHGAEQEGQRSGQAGQCSWP